ncbi:GDSL-type esterase/lipase family protein [Rufibacter roseus]|uniref:GDSL-type esterase/lipase family protein n=1 Tax=Rufibacter roseus TaxID=1567108 RepID=A0ABW2DHW3_9BACT|nr:GDSL-type esterase/lipase family protein [Rufibacter roseus]
MRKNLLNLFCPKFLALLLVTLFQYSFDISASAQGTKDTINIDFGNGTRLSTGGWNNVTDSKAGAVANLVNYQGVNSNIAVAVTDAFNDGSNTAGAAADDSLRIPYNASSDSFFGSKRSAVGGFEPTGGVTFSNLNPQTAYSFAIFANRVDPVANANRETKYTVTGKTTQVVASNPAGPKGYFVRVSNMMPADDGTITVIATTGDNNTNADGYYYLGVIRITYLNTSSTAGPKSVKLLSPNGNESWEAGKQVTVSWQSENIISADLEYSTDNGTSWSPIASSIAAINKKYTWTVPSTLTNQAIVRIKDHDDATVSDVSNNPFTIRADNGKDYTIVVLGSSTAAGAGPTVQDSAWVWRYRTYLTQKSTDFNVVNLAVGGYTTFSILPDNNPQNNITKALSYNPNAIIINMPSNDAAQGYSVQTQMGNYNTIAQLATDANVPLYVTTTQPRNFSGDQTKIQIQVDMVQATRDKFGDNTIDFWTGFPDETNQMKTIYNSGDGVHMNNLAHRILFDRVVGMNIDQAIINNDPLGISKERNANYSVYPNPTSGLLNIATKDGSTIQKITLITASGQKVLEKDFAKTGVQQIDASGLGKGLYLLKVQTAKGTTTSRILLQ